MSSAIAHGSLSFTTSHVVERHMLNFASLSANSNKFFMMELREGNGYQPYCIYTENGRLGGSIQRRDRFYASRAQAQKAYMTLLQSKVKKGYVLVELEAELLPQTSHRQKKEQLHQIADKVLRFIGYLYDAASSHVKRNVQTPLGKISDRQIQRGARLLDEIEQLLQLRQSGRLLSNDDFDQKSNAFYSIIPVTFGAQVDVDRFRINSFKKVAQYRDLLDVMGSIVVAHDLLEETIQEKYEALGIQLAALDEQHAMYQTLLHMVESSHSAHHHFKVRVKNIFEIEQMTGHDTFNPKQLDTQLLFHGSRNANILSIMQKGLLIQPSYAVHHGAMFGNGVYFASDVTKSANYCWSFQRPTDQHESFHLLVAEVATGRICDFRQSRTYLTQAPRGFDSVRGKKGDELLHDEYIVYNTNQIKLKYVIEFERR